MTIRDTPPTRAQFISEHLSQSRPLVVRSGLNSWRDTPPWTFATLVEQVGGQRVPLYDSLFNLVGVSTFRNYVDRYFSASTSQTQPPYLRWFARQSNEHLPWSDDAFETLIGSWHMPEWLPVDGYTFPAHQEPVDVTRQAFPAKGLFVCGRGGMTAWHVDPWHSDAYLCQATGHKRIVLYPPGTPSPTDGKALHTVLADPDALPAGWPIEPLVDVVLAPGDCIYIPQDHPHAAVALSPSLSITWNFVHQSNDTGFQNLRDSGETLDPIIRYFDRTVELAAHSMQQA